MKTITKVFKIAIFLLLVPIYMTTSMSSQISAQDKTSKNDKTNQLETEITTTFKAAKQSMYRKEWQKATDLYSEILHKSPNNPMAEDSFYWLAYCINQLSQKMGNPQQLLSIQKKALARLDTLTKRFPGSRFTDDAQVLKMEIAEGLVNKGFKEFKKYIVNGATKNQDMEMKLIAIESLMQMDKNKAFPILEKIIRTHSNTELRKKALFVLSQTVDTRVIPLLKDVALKDPNMEIRGKAIFWLGQTAGKTALKELLNIYTTLNEKDTALKEKIVFAISQLENKDAVSQLIAMYKKEKDVEVKKKIIFYLGQIDQEEATAFIRDILFQ